MIAVAFFVGLFVGGILGVFVAGLCAASTLGERLEYRDEE